ncbi:MAG: signal peptidase II [Phycisphaeraceae bacterium]|nr:signal peptidase II [Phycisphaeraceae bacterium]
MTPRTTVPAWRSPAAWATLLIVFAAVLSIDLWTKAWSFRTVAGRPVELTYEVASQPAYRPPFHEPVHALPFDLLDFTLVVNHGAVFGLGQHRRGIFVVFTVVAVTVALWVFGWWTNSRSRLAHIGIGLVLAGGIGNLYDRLVYGAVRDFLHMLPRWNLPFGIRWPGGSTEVFPWVFNIADVSLLVGMGLLLIAARDSDRELTKARQATPPRAD